MPLMLASFLVLLYSVILMNRLFNIHHFRSTYKLLDFCYPKTLYQIVSKIHKILKITNKIRNVLNIRDVFKGNNGSLKFEITAKRLYAASQRVL